MLGGGEPATRPCDRRPSPAPAADPTSATGRRARCQPLAFVISALVGILVLGACSGASGAQPAGPGSSAAETFAGRELLVFAASSLTDPFTEIGQQFEGSHPGLKVTFNFAGSPQLRVQIEQGARADLFASANQQEIDIARKNGVIAGPQQV